MLVDVYSFNGEEAINLVEHGVDVDQNTLAILENGTIAYTRSYQEGVSLYILGTDGTFEHVDTLSPSPDGREAYERVPEVTGSEFISHMDLNWVSVDNIADSSVDNTSSNSAGIDH